MIVVDFETYPIVQWRPHYPPKPVGVAIKRGDEPGRYFSGERMSAELRSVWMTGGDLIFHNAMFDLAVAQEQIGLPLLPWRRIHDTMILAFLDDPYGKLGLKDLAKTKLGLANEDVSELHGWIMSNKEAIEREYGGKVTPKTVGAYICAVPEPMRARYAIADVERTHHLFKMLKPRVFNAGMWAAYEREMRLMPILMENERRGLHVDVEALDYDSQGYMTALKTADDAIRTTLNADNLNLDSNDELIQVLLKAGEIDEKDLPRTPTGKISANKEGLHPNNFKTPTLAHAIGYRSRLATCLSTFMGPWLQQAQSWNGRISTHWHQTRADAGGMKTGRIGSSSHNFLNLPKSFLDRDDGYKHPDFLPVPQLPICRRYIKPDPGQTFLHRDFDGQELRMFAHFECGDLLGQYLKNPGLDVHSYIKQVCDNLTGRDLERTKVKVLNFLSIYGGGKNAVAKRLRISLGAAQEFLRIHARALPGRIVLNEEIVRIIRRGGKIRTWGGRLYGLPPHEAGDDPSYKMLNYLVQGSSADLTKQSLVDWESVRGNQTRMLVTVYDEINASAPEDMADAEMAVLKYAMEESRCNTPMLTKGKVGPTWGDLKSCT